MDNAALALCACELLMDGSLGVSKERIAPLDIKRGLGNNIWPGRLQTLSTSPFVLIDGAHNLAAIRNLKNFLSENLDGRDLTLVVGILDDKSYKTMLRHLLPYCTKVIITRPKIDRSLSPETLYPVAKKMVSDVRIIPDVPEAVKTAIETASPEDAVLIAGSLYLVGETMAAIENGEITI
jgi:dihydrofolate synthase/folylpolyglutamate synthase